MKKAYVKPEVYFESFELSTSIAAGCEYTTNHTRGTCAYFVTGIGNVFLTSIAACNGTDGLPIEGDYNGICYHLPSDESNLFTSL